jgi:hypothetical protein
MSSVVLMSSRMLKSCLMLMVRSRSGLHSEAAGQCTYLVLALLPTPSAVCQAFVVLGWLHC